MKSSQGVGGRLEPIPCPLDYEDDVDGVAWREEFEGFLPECLFDVHSHIFLAEHRPSRTGESRNPSHPSVCEAFPLRNYVESMRRLFPGRKVRALLFGTIDAKADLDVVNSYVRDAAQGAGFDALMVLAPGSPADETETKLEAGGFLGFKPYFTLVRDTPPAEVTLEQMIDEPMREVADRRGLILMVHIPRPGRLADPVNVQGMEKLCRECPRAKVVLAHFGRAYFPEAVGDLGRLPDLDNLYVDCSMVQDADVLETVFRRFDHSRIMFGLDMPVAQEKGKVLGINGQRHFFTKKVHPWSIHNSAGAYRIRCTFMAYEIVRALRKAIERCGLGPDVVEKVFHDNAAELVESVKESSGG